MDDGQVANFIAITGASDHVARQLLEISGGDLQQAAVLFFDTDMAETLARQPQAATAVDAAIPTTSTAAGGLHHSNQLANSRRIPTARSAGHQDDEGVIHLDDDSDEDADVLEDMDEDPVDGDAGDTGAAAAAATVARSAQEEEDAAMAKRLQEEMYAESGGGGGGAGAGAIDGDGVRAPIGRTTEVLADGGGDSRFPTYAEQQFLQRMRQQRQQRANNPFNQVWDDDNHALDGAAVAEPDRSSNSSTRGRGGSNNAAAPSRAAQTRQARLADLFRPPYDLIEHMSWNEARSVGKTEKRWILANIQDMSDFQCQALNRDIWKDADVRRLVKESFLFLQYNKEDPGAQSYIQYYMPGGQDENPDNFPHVGIVDPRTGEQVKVWSGRPFPSAAQFQAQLAEFLDRYSLSASKKNPVQRSKPNLPAVPKDVGRMTEEEMLEMALRNSLESGGGEGGGGGEGEGAQNGSTEDSSGRESRSSTVPASRPSMLDPDELTIEPARAAGDDAELAADTEEASAFARIATGHPHEEPAADPQATTRIQFRHATGRIIRRFGVDERVVRIYEWLKASPLEGRTTVQEFELKVMPQGHDLLEDLDKTVAEAGLKQATVMIEYVE